MSIVYLNGNFLPADEARISPLDRGFLFADGVYEVIPCYRGIPFRLEDHLRRLEHSLAGIQLAVPQTRDDWRALFADLVARNGGGNVAIYLQVTRGAPAVRDHAFPTQPVPPTVFAMVTPMKKPPVDLLDAATGYRAITADDIRWTRCDVKSVSLLPNILLRQLAVAQGAAECILLRDGFVTEGAASNIFIVKDGTIATPPLSPHILGGITRDVIIELARDNKVPLAQRGITEAELHSADEVWYSSSTREIVPITRLDEHPVGNGEVGPVWKRMARIYLDHKRSLFGPDA
jgi:D-alanine transaminase